MEVDDIWAWLAIGPKRQPDAAAGAPAVSEDAPAADEGDQAVPALVQASQQPPPPPPPAAARTMPQRLGRLEEEVQGLRRDVGTLCGLVQRSMTDQGRFSTWMISIKPGRPHERNIDEVGGMNILWNSMCVMFVLGFRRFSSTQSCSITQLGESTEQISG
ncbi:hypothetical protein Tco_0145062 [Tanacetum coccineum]